VDRGLPYNDACEVHHRGRSGNKTAELNQALELLVQSYDDTLQVLGSALELKDAETAAHCQRVTAYTISIAKSVPVPRPYLPVLARAAFLHDIGKMAIPDKILRNPAPLDDSEKQIMRLVRAIHVACAVNRFLSGHASSPSPMLSMPC